MEELPGKNQHDADVEKTEDAEGAAGAVVKDSETKAFEIAEFSDRSSSNSSGSSRNADSDGSAQNKEEKEEGEGEGTATSPRSAAGAEVKEDQPPSLDAAEAKGDRAARRAHAQPESKRGGRRDTARTGLFPLNRWVGRRKSHHEVGDLVEAEWAGSRWWYVGYVEREVPVIAGGNQKKGLYHVVFADGDEADVDGRHLKQLGPSGGWVGGWVGGYLFSSFPVSVSFFLFLARQHERESPTYLRKYTLHEESAHIEQT